MPTRPPIERTLSAQSQVEVLESPPISESTLSTTSVIDDQDPTPPVTHHDSDGADTVKADAEEEERGRSASIDTSKYEMDPRNMSPRRDSEELDQLGAEAKEKLEAYVNVPFRHIFFWILSLFPCATLQFFFWQHER